MQRLLLFISKTVSFGSYCGNNLKDICVDKTFNLQEDEGYMCFILAQFFFQCIVM